MAVANQNPGTTPATEPQAGGSNPTEGGGVTPPPKRLIAGKYETLEDAVENGIFGLENAYHKTREDIAKLTRVVELAVGGGNNPPPIDPRGGYAPVGTAGRGSYGDQYGRGQPQPDDVDPTKFLVNPGEVLRERDARLLQRVAGVVENVVGNAMVVAEFKRQNPDLAPHERIVSAFMRETDQTKPYADRLSDAAKMTKEYLVALRAAGGGNQNPSPTGGNYVESPRGAGPGGAPPIVPGGGSVPHQVDPDEQELIDYINERNTDISARFGIKTK
ncbi:MAG TPA: hypothetical protein VH593_13025 [Ktedonobacteraceae bacterium]